MYGNAIRHLALAGALSLGLTLSASALPSAPPAGPGTIEACGGKGGCGCGKKKDSDTSCDKCGTSECSCGKDSKKADKPDPSAEVIDLKNEKCPIMGGKAQADVFTDYEGVRVHFCCPGCDKKFLADPAKYLKKLGIDDLDEFKRQRANK